MTKTNEILLLYLPVSFPPPVTDITKNEEGHGSQVNNTRIQGLGRLFTQLLGSLRTNRTLGLRFGNKQAGEKNKTTHNENALQHTAGIYTKVMAILQIWTIGPGAS